MPFLILILSAVGGAIWWWIVRNPRDAFSAASDIATTVKNAPRKLAFNKQAHAHPVEGIDDPRIAICAIGQAFIELDDLPTKEQREKLNSLLRSKLGCASDEAHEMEVLGRWLLNQCNGAKAAVPRLSRRLYKIDGNSSWRTLQEILMELVGDDLSESQEAATQDIALAFKR